MMDTLDLSFQERVIFQLRSLYSSRGYTRFKMNKFEEYDLYASNRDFLISDSVLTFTDLNGRLMALKPDVTLSIVKSSRDDPDALQKLYYNETVYRAVRGTYRELMQVGLECIGAIDDGCIAEVLAMAAESLALIRSDAILNISHLGLIRDIVEKLAIPERKQGELRRYIGEKNIHELTALCRDCGGQEKAVGALRELICLTGEPETVLPRVRELLTGIVDTTAVDQLIRVTGMLSSEAKRMLRVDFSAVDDPHYYNGILFKGFLPGVPGTILSGGQYDNLMKKMGRRSGAVGFAVYVDLLERLEETAPAVEAAPMLNIALPKGRLGDKVYAMFEKAGFGCPAIYEGGRKLTFENPQLGIRFFWVKPSDVAIYVERGAADIGVAGKDILLEYEPEVYELLDLNIGKCRMAVAAKEDFRDDPRKTLRVATKFSKIAANHYLARGRDIDIIHLNGSIEIAPILGLSDVIVDIVETGTTLRENGLQVMETVVPISARLIANKAGYQFKCGRIEKLIRELAAQVEA